MAYYSIRFMPEDVGPCFRCKADEIGRGPVGFYINRPICDFCLLNGQPDLGMLLVHAHFARELARLRRLHRDVSGEALEFLSTWARIYDLASQPKWPPRLRQLMDRLAYGLHPGDPPS